MKTISDHIRHIHGKPHHVRRQVAYGVAATGAGLVALVWLGGSLAGGVFALKDTSFADSTGTGPAVTVVDKEGNAQVAGAAAAPAVEDKNAPAHIDIVDVTPKPAPKAEQTTIPF